MSKKSRILPIHKLNPDGTITKDKIYDIDEKVNELKAKHGGQAIEVVNDIICSMNSEENITAYEIEFWTAVQNKLSNNN